MEVGAAFFNDVEALFFLSPKAGGFFLKEVSKGGLRMNHFNKFSVKQAREETPLSYSSFCFLLPTSCFPLVSGTSLKLDQVHADFCCFHR